MRMWYNIFCVLCIIDIWKNFFSMYSEEDTKNLYYLLDDLSNKHQAHRNVYKIKKDYLK